MKKKEKIISIFITLIVSLFAVIPSFKNNIALSTSPSKLFKVYLDGIEIGIISSKDKLTKYIDEEQKELKENLGVDLVYLPNNLNIEEYIGYQSEVIDEKTLYNNIKDKTPFTVKGSVITIKKVKEDETFDIIKINVLREQDYIDAVESVIKTFVNENEYNIFFDGNIFTNFELGSTIEDIYVEEESLKNVTIRRDVYIPSNELIFKDSKTLTHYLLFGNLEEQEKYKVKRGDTIESIAFNNKLGTKEFLIISPEFTSETNLLYEGQEVSIAQMDPVLNIVKEEKLIENVPTKYKTVIKYDSSKPYGYYNVTQEGVDGIDRVTKKIRYINGEVGQAQMSDQETIRPSVERIEVRGARIANDPVVVADAGNWAWPTETPYFITSVYGWRYIRGTRQFHAAIDIITTKTHGSPVYAANDGNVMDAGIGYNGGRGNYLVINHNNGYLTAYYHLHTLNVTKGEAVDKGKKIGTIGNTGRSYGAHLHFAVYRGSYNEANAINPLLLYR